MAVENEIAERIFDALNKEKPDIEAINRGLNDFASIGWKMAAVYRFIARNNDKVSVIHSKDYDILFLVNGKFDLSLHQKYIDIFIQGRKNKAILDKYFKHRVEMTPEELSWITSTKKDDILELAEYIK